MTVLRSDIHQKLIGLQTETELARKAAKARTRKFWTQEEIDYIARKAERQAAEIKWE